MGVFYATRRRFALAIAHNLSLVATNFFALAAAINLPHGATRRRLTIESAQNLTWGAARFIPFRV